MQVRTQAPNPSIEQTCQGPLRGPLPRRSCRTLGPLSHASMNTSVLNDLVSLRRPQEEAHIGPPEYRSTESVEVEQALANTPALPDAARSEFSERASRVAVLRTALVVGSVAAAVVAWLASSAVGQAGEPELALLLRGMAAIKGLLALSAASLVWWRLGQPVSLHVASTYLVCSAALFFSTVLIWQLAFILAAAALFHAAGLVGLVVAMREGRQMPRFGQQAPNPSIERTA